MKTYPIPMVPGPVRAHPAVLEAYRVDYGSADLEPEYLELYTRTERNLKAILETQQSVAVFLGEGMMALWGGLKSVLCPGDRLLAIGTGVYGYGIGEMAAALGAEVRTVGLPYDETLADLSAVEEAWQIDLCLGGAQKCLSALPDTCFVAVSESAWGIIDQVNYAGYDAIKPFKTAVVRRYFPYTPGWQATAGLNAGAEAILNEGLENCFRRHAEVAAFCRRRLVEIGYALFPAPDAVPAPTVTAVKVPEGIAWPEFDRRLRARGLVVGGSYGPIAGKVFRLGHMGTQADMGLVDQALEVLEEEFK